eukprot:2000185-Pyramimonas_sp.AAC.1
MLPDLSDGDLREVGLRLGHIKRFRSAVASQRDDEEAAGVRVWDSVLPSVILPDGPSSFWWSVGLFSWLPPLPRLQP